MSGDKGSIALDKIGGILQCPLCRSGLGRRGNTLKCEKNHSFDLSKYGYVSFNPKHREKMYTKELFQNRQQVFDYGFYEPVANEITARLKGYFSSGTMNILDAGCGEGYYGRHVKAVYGERAAVIGLDIVKDAVLMAARKDKGCCWIVGDLARIPLKDQSLDVILNILTPGDYKEFQRVLKPQGVVVKLSPGAEYLTEIRQLTGQAGREEPQSLVMAHFARNMAVQESFRIKYRVDVTPEQVEAFVKMTPLTHHKEVSPVQYESLKHVTIDLDMAIGMPLPVKR